MMPEPEAVGQFANLDVNIIMDAINCGNLLIQIIFMHYITFANDNDNYFAITYFTVLLFYCASLFIVKENVFLLQK